MGKIARPVRNSSKQRTEVVTTSKTVTLAESGETYFVSGSSAVTLTLPAAENGLYFRVVPHVGMTKAVAVTSSTSYVAGGILQVSGAAAISMVLSGQSYGAKITPITVGASGSDYMEVRAVELQAGSSTYAYVVNGIVSGAASFTA